MNTCENISIPYRATFAAQQVMGIVAKPEIVELMYYRSKN